MGHIEDANKLVEQNHNLIYDFCKKNFLKVDDFYDILAIGLIKASRTFDESRGLKFSTYAYVCMRNELNMERRKEIRNVLKNIIPLDKEYESNDPSVTDKVTMLDKISYDISMENIQRSKIDFKIPKTINEEEMKIIQLIKEGYTQRQIATQLDYSIQTINRKVSIIRDKIRDNNNYSKTRDIDY